MALTLARSYLGSYHLSTPCTAEWSIAQRTFVHSITRVVISVQIETNSAKPASQLRIFFRLQNRALSEISHSIDWTWLDILHRQPAASISLPSYYSPVRPDTFPLKFGTR